MVRLFPLSLMAGCDFEHNVLIDGYSSDDFNTEMVLKIADIAPIKIVANEISDGSFKFVFTSELIHPTTKGVAVAQIFVTDKKSTLRTFIGDSKISIIPDLSNVDANYDCRSHAEKMLQAINEMLEGRITDKAEEIEYNPQYGASRKLKFASKSELYSLKMRYTEIVKTERKAEIIRNGGKVYDYKVARFTNV